jgi:hypothetical protein
LFLIGGDEGIMAPGKAFLKYPEEAVKLNVINWKIEFTLILHPNYTEIT